MIEPAVPKLQWGQRVRACVDLYNDGSFPDWPAEALLVRTGDPGEIVQVGTHTDLSGRVFRKPSGRLLGSGNRASLNRREA
jgi:nitrogen fixation protein NifZ